MAKLLSTCKFVDRKRTHFVYTHFVSFILAAPLCVSQKLAPTQHVNIGNVVVTMPCWISEPLYPLSLFILCDSALKRSRKCFSFVVRFWNAARCCVVAGFFALQLNFKCILLLLTAIISTAHFTSSVCGWELVMEGGSQAAFFWQAPMLGDGTRPTAHMRSLRSGTDVLCHFKRIGLLSFSNIHVYILKGSLVI